MLFGRKQPHSQIRRWLNGERSHDILVVHGPTGAGKTRVVDAMIAEANLDPIHLIDADKVRQTISLARSPTFTGQTRIMVIDGVDVLNRHGWNEISKTQDALPFPLVIISDTLNDIEKDISRRSFPVKIDRPSKVHLLDFLRHECEVRKLTHTEAILGTIAGSAHSYRSAKNALDTTPPTASIDDLESRRPAVTGSAQSEAILRGQWIGDFSVHPLSILNMAEWNSADPETVAQGLLLHSRSWAADGLSPVARAYLRTLRTSSWDRPPFRDRQIRGSVRR